MTDKSSETNNVARVQLYPPSQQGSGSFDEGRITEIKPIGFRGDGSAVPRIGPLFYWAWATANGATRIDLHPHKGFEIVSYVLQGEIGHFDTGGHRSRIRAGGLQVMQTGSGISHEESTVDGHNEFFQIWFEPNLSQALTRPPTYREFAADELPVRPSNGIRVTSIIGPEAPVQLVADGRMEHWTAPPNARHPMNIQTERVWAMVAIEGNFAIQSNDKTTRVQRRDFVVVYGGLAPVTLVAGDAPVQVIRVDVPAQVDYPLLPK